MNTETSSNPRGRSTSTAPTAISRYEHHYEFDAGRGLTNDTIDYISDVKERAGLDPRIPPQGAQDIPSRSRCRRIGRRKDLENIDLRQHPLLSSDGQKPKRSWDEVPDDVKRTFERLGIPEQERKFLAGVEAQFD